MESHSISASNVLLENIDGNIPMSITLTTPSNDIVTSSKNLATTPCRNSLETELIALKSLVLGQFYLRKKSIQDIKDPNHDTVMEHI